MNTMNGPVVGCEIELRNGQFCGIPAIGRCATCGRAFCLTHQGRYYDNFRQLVPYVDMCAPCAAVKQAEEVRRKEEAQAPFTYFYEGAARTALLAAGVPPVDIYKTERRWERKTGIFGIGGREIEVATATLFGHGWILGEFKWKYRYGPYEGTLVVKDRLTALLDKSPDDPGWYGYQHYGNNQGLAIVQPCSGGYEALGVGGGGRFVGNGWTDGSQWREVAQAVKRLTGESS